MRRALVPDDLFLRVLRARDHVRDAYDQPLTVASLARTAHLGVAPRTFQRAARTVTQAPGLLVTVYVPFCFAERFAP